MNKRNVRDEYAEWKAAPSRPFHNRANAKVTPAIVAYVLAQVKQGRPYAKIARDMHLNVCTVTAIRKRHGHA